MANEKKKRRKSIKTTDPLKVEFIGEKYLEESLSQLFIYNRDEFLEFGEVKSRSLEDFQEEGKIYWFNTHGIHDVNRIHQICTYYGIHRLVIQDILDTNQRPKLQEFEKYSFFTVKSILPSQQTQLEIEQISFVLGSHFVISFQEKKGDHFEHIRQRIREGKGVIRERGADYLLYLLLQSILENYSNTLETLDPKTLSLLSLNETSEIDPDVILKIEELRKELSLIRKALIPLRDALNGIEKGLSKMVLEETKKYFMDLKDETLYLLEILDTYNQRLESGTNLFFSLQGHKMNQIMKTLTVVASIFIPLTFIAGIYGMNFENMPELKWPYGYFVVWGIMSTIMIGMFIYFWRKRWF